MTEETFEEFMTEETLREFRPGLERAWENAKDHAKRGGLRGRYTGEGLKTGVFMMLDYDLGYTKANTVLVCLGALLLREHGFSDEEIRTFWNLTTE